MKVRPFTREPPGRQERSVREAIGAALASSYAHLGISITAALLVTPLYLRGLGQERYGVWLTFSSWLAYLSISSLGIPQAAQNRAAEAHAQGHQNDVGKSLVAAVWSTVAFSLLAATILGLAAVAGLIEAPFRSASSETRRDAVPAVLMICLAYLLTLPAEQFRAVLRALGHFATAQVISTLGVAAAAAAGTLVVWLDASLITFSLSQALVMLATGALSAWAGRRAIRNEGHSVYFRHISIKDVTQLLAPSLQFLVIAMAGALIWSTDNLVIAAYLGPAEVTPYAVSLRLVTLATSVISAMTVVLIPVVTSLWATDDLSRLAALSAAATRIALAVGTLLAVELVLIGRPFVTLWAGEAALVHQVTLLIFVATFLIRTLAQSMELVVVGISRQKAYAAVVLAEGFANLLLSLALVRRFGATGVALGTLIAHLSFTGWFLPWWAARSLGVSLIPIFGRVLRPLSCGVIAYMVGRKIAAPSTIDSWQRLAVVATIAAFTYALGYAIVGLSKVERQSLHARLRGATGR